MVCPKTVFHKSVNYFLANMKDAFSEFPDSVYLSETFPLNSDISEVWKDRGILPSVPIPEPTTLVLFVTGVGIIPTTPLNNLTEFLTAHRLTARV